MIKVVTFDLWNTLLMDRNYTDLRSRYLADILKEQRIVRKREEIIEAYVSTQDYVHEIWEKENYRNVTTEERVNHILQNLHVKLPKEIKNLITREFEEAILEDLPPLVSGVKETLETLSIKYKLGIISDTGFTLGYVCRKVLNKSGVLNHFSSTTFSDEVHFNKPHRIIFETALRELNTYPSEAVHVGDLLQTDVAGAKAIGMKAVWINLKGKVGAKDIHPDYEISDLPEIITVLSS